MIPEITFENYDKPLEYNVRRLEALLAGTSKVNAVQHRLSTTFTLLFRENFLDLPLSSITNGVQNRSNWTHHTYYAIRTTARSMFLSCTYETMGRLDAVIETVTEHPGVILVAEWETNAFSVFGSGQELEKLWAAVGNHKYADAFLFTYCPFNRLSEFLPKVVEYWQSRPRIRETFPTLFLTIIATRKRMRNDEFVFMRTLEIDSDVVGLWHDIGFVELDDYKALLESEGWP